MVPVGSLKWGVSAFSSEEGQGANLSFSNGSDTFRGMMDQEIETRESVSKQKTNKTNITREALQKS